ncbi:MAG: hypothetical protein ABSA93_31285 [Streptosporangiaceae bacterium]
MSPSSTGLFSGTASAPDSASASASASRKATATATASASASASASPTPSPSPSSYYPTAAPVTGGGGTAGLQDTGLLAVGILAIVAGAGAFVLRRRLSRDH